MGWDRGMEIDKTAFMKQMILRLGVRRFGYQTPEIKDKLEAINSNETLEYLIGRLMEVETWGECFMNLD